MTRNAWKLTAAALGAMLAGAAIGQAALAIAHGVTG